MGMTTDEITSLTRIKLTADVVSMIVDRMNFKKIRKDDAVWMIREKIHDLNSELEKLRLTTSGNSLIDK